MMKINIMSNVVMVRGGKIKGFWYFTLLLLPLFLALNIPKYLLRKQKGEVRAGWDWVSLCLPASPS